MKLSNLTKVIGAGALTLSMAAMPLVMPASAQSSSGGSGGTGSTGGTDTTTTAPSQGTSDARHDNGFDWGWLGLIGLAGLAGLARKQQEPVAYRDPAATSRTNYNE